MGALEDPVVAGDSVREVAALLSEGGGTEVVAEEDVVEPGAALRVSRRSSPHAASAAAITHAMPTFAAIFAGDCKMSFMFAFLNQEANKPKRERMAQGHAAQGRHASNPRAEKIRTPSAVHESPD